MPGPKLAIDIHADASDLSQAAINFSGSGTNQVIAGIAGQVIRVWKIFFNVAGATSITYQDGAIAVSGPLGFAANEGIVLDFDTKPWVTCSIGNPFQLNSSNAVQVSGTVYYTQG